MAADSTKTTPFNPLRVLLWALGVIYAAALAYGLYWGWTNSGLALREIPNPYRGVVADLRAPILVALGIVALSVAQWIWRNTLARLDPDDS